VANDLKALVLDCTLKKSPGPSSSMLLAEQVVEALGSFDVGAEIVRVVDHDVRFGVTTDEGDGGEWPEIRRRMLDADIVVRPDLDGTAVLGLQDGPRATRRRAR